MRFDKISCMLAPLLLTFNDCLTNQVLQPQGWNSCSRVQSLWPQSLAFSAPNTLPAEDRAVPTCRTVDIQKRCTYTVKRLRLIFCSNSIPNHQQCLECKLSEDEQLLSKWGVFVLSINQWMISSSRFLNHASRFDNWSQCFLISSPRLMWWSRHFKTWRLHGKHAAVHQKPLLRTWQ